MSRPEEAPAARRPAAVLFVSAVLVLEALALLAAAGWYIYNLLTSAPLSMGGAIFTTVLLAAAGIWLLAVGHFFFRGYRWTRAAALAWQLFMVVLAVTVLQAGLLPAGLLMLLPAAAVMLLVFSTPVLNYTVRRGGDTKAP